MAMIFRTLAISLVL